MHGASFARRQSGGGAAGIKKAGAVWICMRSPQHRENAIARYRLAKEHLEGEAAEPVRT